MAASVTPLLAELMGAGGDAIDESQLEFLQEIADTIVEDMGGGTAKWLLRSSAEELKESVMPIVEDAGYSGSEEDVFVICCKILLPETLEEQKAGMAASPEPEDEQDDLGAAFAAGDVSMEAIWGAVQMLDEEEFSVLHDEIADLIDVRRGPKVRVSEMG